MTWHAKHFVIFEEWLKAEATNADCLATVKDLIAWLQGNRDMVRLQAIFVVDHAQQVFEDMDQVQVAVAALFNNQEENGRPKPHIHRVHNRLHSLHSSLQTAAEQKRLKALTVARLHRKQANRINVHSVGLWHGRFVEIPEAAA